MISLVSTLVMHFQQSHTLTLGDGGHSETIQQARLLLRLSGNEHNLEFGASFTSIENNKVKRKNPGDLKITHIISKRCPPLTMGIFAKRKTPKHPMLIKT